MLCNSWLDRLRSDLIASPTVGAETVLSALPYQVAELPSVGVDDFFGQVISYPCFFALWAGFFL